MFAFGLLLALYASRVMAEVVWQPYAIRSFDGREIAAEMAILPVRENRDERDSRWIRIAVVRLPRAGTAPRDASPIVFLSGGPGIPATALARVPVYFDLFSRLRDVGDVLLVDQRGSGLSVPNLTCPERELPRDFLSSDAAFRDALRSRVSDCAQFWRNAGVDLKGYSTREIAEDIDVVRRAVHASRTQLLAFSYGSEVAFELARRWQRSIERIVFASTRAPDTLLKRAGAWDRQLDDLGEVASVPLRSMVRDVVAKFDRAPVVIEIPGGTVSVGGIGVLTLLRSDLSDGRTFAAIPQFVQTLERNDYATLTRRIQQLHASLTKHFNLMTLAVDCSSGWSPERLAATQAGARNATMRNVNLQWDSSICALIRGTPGIPPAISLVPVPTLFVTGTLDPSAPIAQTEQIRARFPRSVHLIVENGAHETLPLPAVQDEVMRFLRGAPLTTRKISSSAPGH